MDSPYVVTPQACSKPHVYQTFAAIRLDYTPRRRSQLTDDPHAKAVCNRRVADKMVQGVDIDTKWEVMVIPPQFESDTVYRCIVGNGTRTGALKMSGG